LQTDGITHTALSDSLLNGHQQILIAPPYKREFRVSCNPHGMRGEQVKAMIEARHILPQDVFQQHESVLPFVAWKLNKSRDNLSRNMNDRKFRVRQK
jgi:hypothetical protein